MNEQNIIWGTIDPNGNIVSGTTFIDSNGHVKYIFKVDKADTGLYTIILNGSFSTIPGVSTTQIYPDDVNNKGGNTRDNAVLVGVRNDRFRVKTGNGDGNAENRFFSFIAIGYNYSQVL